MNEKIRTSVSVVLVAAVVLLLAFPFVPAIASDEGTSEKRSSEAEAVIVEEEALQEPSAEINDIEAAVKPPENEEPWEVTSLDISKDVDTVTAPGMEISLEKTASESLIEMMVGETADVTFTIEVEAQSSDSYYIAGDIFVQNTGEWPADVIAVSDTVWYKAGGPDWLAATSNITTTVPMGDNAIPTGGPHVYSYAGTFNLPVPLASVTSMSNLIEITISNKPDPPKPGMQDWTFHYRQDFAKPAAGGSTEVSLEDIETITPAEGLSYVILSVTINGAEASLTGPWALDLADAPFTIVIDKELSAEKAGEYILNNKARIGDLVDEVDVEIVVREPDVEKGSIEGYKYLDLDADGQHDEGEPGLEGVTVHLISDGQIIDSTVTDENGRFAFLDLEPGDYLVQEVVPDGYYPTSENPVEVALGEGEKAEIHFLNALEKKDRGSIEGRKYLDLDADGQHDEGEPGLEGVTVKLYRLEEPAQVAVPLNQLVEVKVLVAETITDENGDFSFADLEPGRYVVEEVVPDGYYPTSPVSIEVEVEAGSRTFVLFLNAPLEKSDIRGYKYLDLNGNGFLDAGESGLEGVTIQLMADGEVVAETVTDETGYFEFTGLESGEYTVRELMPDGYYATSDEMVRIDLEDGEDAETYFLNAPYAALSGNKWLDSNANGQFDEGEEGLGGVTIRLLDEEGEEIAAMQSEADGSYRFDDLRAGAYTVEEIVPDGYVATSPAAVEFFLSPGEDEVIDFHNSIQVAGEVVTPVTPEAEGGQTLPATGLEMTYLLILIGAMIFTGLLIASFGMVRLTR